ncbi:uncharacterized protein LW93_186 [Fusarium fujikuroi]|nr:uncharacterized protein LW93_186 [Fusarium fujikuroi]
MSYIVPYVDIPDHIYKQAYALHEVNRLWSEDLYADGEIFRELAQISLDALPLATPVQNSSQDITPSDATTAVDATAVPPTPNDYGPKYIFDESGYRFDHGFTREIELELYMPQTGLTLLRDHMTRSTETKLLVVVDLKTYNKWTYGWSVTFSTHGPFKTFNRGGEFISDAGRRVEACVYAFCEAINSVVDFINDSRYEKPPISNIYVRVPQFRDSKYALHRLLREVEQGETAHETWRAWVRNMYNAVSKTLVQMRKLRAEGVHVRMWQNIKQPLD